MSGSFDSWRLAAEALASLVREDYPSDLSLSEIARRWGVGLTPEHLAALAAIERELPPEMGLGIAPTPLERRDADDEEAAG